MSSCASLMRRVKLHETINFVSIRRWGDIVRVFSDIQIRLFAKTKTLLTLNILVLRVILMLGRS